VATLHIEHPISDLETWLGAFNRFEDARQKAGVRSQRVHQPVDDDKYIFVTLDFGSVAAATAFKSFLESTVWASAQASPALAGTPKSPNPHRGSDRARAWVSVVLSAQSRHFACVSRDTPSDEEQLRRHSSARRRERDRRASLPRAHRRLPSPEAVTRQFGGRGIALRRLR
jgi:hypothetical protein